MVPGNDAITVEQLAAGIAGVRSGGEVEIADLVRPGAGEMIARASNMAGIGIIKRLLKIVAVSGRQGLPQGGNAVEPLNLLKDRCVLCIAGPLHIGPQTMGDIAE